MEQQGWPYVDKDDDPWSSHNQIRALLARRPPGTRVLDVGTATGTLGRMCQGAGFIMTGIEPNQDWVRVARSHYERLVCATLDEAPDELLRGHDVVVCADVLEHMARPEQALQRLIQLQQPGCTFLISVPNVANLWIRLNLLAGRFNYTERGILDRTHLRFFTRSTFLAFLRGAGLRVVSLDVTPIPLTKVHPLFSRTGVGRMVHRLFARTTSLLPRLLGYQFIGQAVIPGGEEIQRQ